MLVRRAVVVFGKHCCFPIAGSSLMPVLAIAAREAGQGKQVQAEYAEKLLHVVKVTRKWGKWLLQLFRSMFASQLARFPSNPGWCFCATHMRAWTDPFLPAQLPV